jgi:transposase
VVKSGRAAAPCLRGHSRFWPKVAANDPLRARRRGLTPQQLFTWRREARLRSDAPEGAEPSFVRAVVDGSCSTPVRQPESRFATLQSSVELEINGIIVRIGRDAPAGTIVAVLRALKATA